MTELHRRPSMPVLRRTTSSRRLSGLVLLVLILSGAALTGCGQEPPEEAFRPTIRPLNLLVILVDTLRQDHLQCYGYPRATAPNICRLAEEGVLLDGIAPSSWTKPSTASLLTGLHPLHHQAIERNDLLPDAAHTLAEILSAEGFATLGASANGWVSPIFGFDQGFDPFLRIRSRDGQPATAAAVNRELLPQLPELPSPFFLYVHYVDPHEPYDPPTAWDGEPLAPNLAERAPLANSDLDMANFIVRDPLLVRDAIDLYDGEIRSVDAAIGDLLRRMDELGLLDRTLTVITSDHGEEFDEHGRVGHGMSLYQEVSRVPLILHLPGAVPPDRSLMDANLMDMAPTVLDFLGVEPAEKAFRPDGRSLRSTILEGGRSPQDDRHHLLHLDLDGRPSLAMLRGQQKLLLAQRPYRKQLFDQRGDPREQHNLLEAGEEDDRAAGLATDLAEEYNRLLVETLERQTRETADDEARALQALGYVSPSDQTLQSRLIPDRIHPAGPRGGGLLGWEGLHGLESCLELDSPQAERQLLQGWRFAELGGRFTLPVATMLLAPPASPTSPRLHLEGHGHRPGSFTLTVWLGERRVLQQRLPPDPFSVTTDLEISDLQASSLLLRLEVDPPFAPAPPEVGKPHWTLGVLLRRVCLTPD